MRFQMFHAVTIEVLNKASAVIIFYSLQQIPEL